MRRLLLASLAFLLLFLPLQVGTVQARPESCCGGCAGMPACPPKCPAPPTAPAPLPPGLASAPVEQVAESEARRAMEPSPAPALLPGRTAECGASASSFIAPVDTGPPDRADVQAFLRVFRI